MNAFALVFAADQIWLRLIASTHGALGILAAVALLHPAILLRRGRPLSRGVRWALGGAAALVFSAYAIGIAIYEDYRGLVKRDLFVRSEVVGYLFETKEHLAFAALTIALGAAVLATFAPRERSDLRQLASALFGSAALLTFVVVGLGLWVSAHASF